MDVLVRAAVVAPLTVLGMVAGMASISSQTREVRLGGPSSPVVAATRNQDADPPPFPERSASGEGWVVMTVSSDHGAVVIDVEARRLEMARAIAIQILRPIRARRYHEILIYVRLPGSGVKAAMRRIQWTPRGGIVETKFEAVP